VVIGKKSRHDVFYLVLGIWKYVELEKFHGEIQE
jgi:hypothetical protein